MWNRTQVRPPGRHWEADLGKTVSHTPPGPNLKILDWIPSVRSISNEKHKQACFTRCSFHVKTQKVVVAALFSPSVADAKLG